MRTGGAARRPSSLAAVLVGVTMLSGCAARHSSPLTERLVRRGEPAVNLGGPPIATTPGVRAAAEKQKAVTAHPITRHVALGGTVESANGRLAAALLADAMLPSAAAHVRVATEYKRLGVLDAAFAAFTRALHEQPSLSVAHEGLARVWRDWGMPEQGLGAAYRATFHDRRSASAQNTLGTVLGTLGYTELARKAFERALALDPNASWALNNLCYVDYQLGRLELARAECEAALKLKPDFVAAHNNMGLVYAADGDVQQARRAFLAAGDEASADFNLGMTFLQRRDYEAAAGAFEDAIRARPGFTDAKRQAHGARLRALTGQH
jgi:tetratricopeptide (TPR) repeat protein